MTATRYPPVRAGVLPVGATTEPADFAGRRTLTNCGVTSAFDSPNATPSAARRAADDAVVSCWLRARAVGGTAEARVTGVTTDSGPAHVYLRTFGGQVEAWLLFRDQLIGPGAPVTWAHERCRKVDLRGFALTSCTP